MPSFNDTLNIPGHLSIYKLSKRGRIRKIFSEPNIVVSGMGVGLSQLLTTSSRDTVDDFQLSRFQVGVSGFSGNQVATTYELSGPLSSTAEYGVNSNLELEMTYQIKNGRRVPNNVFAVIPKSKVNKIKDQIVRYTIVLDEEACNNLNRSRGDGSLSEIGLFMKNPSRIPDFNAPLLVAYRTFAKIKKTDDFSLIFRWTLFGDAAEPRDLPESVEGPTPEDGETDVPLSATLSWAETSGAVSYAVYLGTSPTFGFGDFQGNQGAPPFYPVELLYGTTYYWRIDSIGLFGTTQGEVWSFTTEDDPLPPDPLPGQVSNPNPTDDELDVSISATLSWDAASGTDSYSVYLGTGSSLDSSDFKGSQSGLDYTSSVLTYDTSHLWRIDSVNTQGITPGPTWAFLTEANPNQPPEQVLNLSPASGTTDLSSEGTVITWSGAGDASGYNVYFGATSILSPLDFQGETTASSYDPSTLAYSTTYYWRIDAVSEYGTTSGIKWSFTTEASPPPPSAVENPIPASGAIGVSISATLSWDASVEASGYDVYFGTSSTPGAGQFQGSQSGITFDPGTLSYSTTYYWRIDPESEYGTTSGTIWNFTTEDSPPPPDPVTNPDPFDGETDVSSEGLTLSWDASVSAASYDVYFGTSSTPGAGQLQGNQAGVTFDPGTLDWETDYYWRVDPVSEYGTTSGFIWTFTTSAEPVPAEPPGQVSNPTPADGTSGVSIDLTLYWEFGLGASSYDVYLGDVSALESGHYQGNYSRGILEFTPSAPLDYSSLYYWRVDSVNPVATTSGAVWSFGTEAQPDPPSAVTNPSPADETSDVSIDATLSWTASVEASGYDVYFGTSSTPGPGQFQGNQTGTTFDPGTLSYATDYYWRIDSVSQFGTTTGSVWTFTTESAPVAPTVTTQAVTSISQTTAVGNGNVTSDGGASVTQRGVVLAETTGPTLSDLVFSSTTSGTGTFTANVTGLDASTHYFVKAYATNSAGTSYGNEVEFDTLTEVEPPAEGDTVATVTARNLIASSTPGFYNILRGTIPVASGLSSYDFYLRDNTGVAWPTDTNIVTRGPSSLEHPSGEPQVVELLAKVRVATTADHTFTVESGLFESAGDFQDLPPFYLAASAPFTEGDKTRVNFVSRFIFKEEGPEASGTVVKRQRYYGELGTGGAKLCGYSAYVTTVDGIPDVWLVEMLLYNAGVGTPESPLGTAMLPDLFFNEIKFLMQPEYIVSHFNPTPYTTPTHLMAPNANGKDHVLYTGAMKPYRFVIHKTTNVGQAGIINNHKGFFTCDPSKTLWSWSNPDTAFYGPQQYMVPSGLNLVNDPGYGASATTIINSYAAGVPYSDEYAPVLTSALGPYHLRGATDGGQSGGVGIEAFRGYELISEGSVLTLQTYMITTAMDCDRQAGHKWNFGSPYSCGPALVDPTQKPITGPDWDMEGLVFISNPGKFGTSNFADWPRQALNQWRRDWASSQGLIPDYYGDMNAYFEIKDSHIIRVSGSLFPQIWLFNDPIAKEVLQNFSFWGRARVYEEGGSDLSQVWYGASGPQTYPGKGGGGGICGRIGGWAILNHCADFLISDQTRRETFTTWFNRYAEYLAASQLPSGSWQAFTQFSLPSEPGGPGTSAQNTGGDHPNGDLYWQWVANGYPWDVDPNVAGSQAIEAGMYSQGVRGLHNCTGDQSFLDMLNVTCSGLWSYHWKRPGGIPQGAPHFVTPVRNRTDITVPAWTDLNDAPECATDNTDNYQIGAMIAAGLTYDILHPEAWQALHAMTGTSYGAGPGQGDVAGLITSLTNVCLHPDAGQNKLSEGWGTCLALITDYQLNN